jgi:hypothetical protein
MHKSDERSGFALIVTLVLMALIVVVVVAYLGNTRTDRSASSLYANRLRAKMMADSGLTAATTLLYDNTKYGNYITAMPAPAAPAASPTPIRTELYRPTDPSSPSAAADHLRLDNAVGEVLVSRAVNAASSGVTVQVDPRPAPASIAVPATGGSWGLPDPGFTSADSYDFNQIVRVGRNASARLVDPSTPSKRALAQWVRVRDTNGRLVGRYAFFIEDESMKLNVDVVGNNLGSITAPNRRTNDLLLPPVSATPTPTPSPAASQIQEVDPTALVLPQSRAAANTALTAAGVPGKRLSTKATISLLGGPSPSPTPWSGFDEYAHLITTVSKDDNTTAKGWQRLNINELVADAQSGGTNADKKAAALRIANWIRDAWTGPTSVGALADHQLFGDDRLRQQIAASIVDYIDSDNTPTDMGDVSPSAAPGASPSPSPVPVPVIGFEKTPYLAAVEVIYEASNSTCPSPAVAGTYTADVRMRVRFRFVNLFETTLDLADSIGRTDRSRIEVTGIPVVSKNGSEVFNPHPSPSPTPFTIKLSDLTPVNGSDTTVPPGTDDQSDSGARSFESPWLVSQTARPFVVQPNDQNPRLLADKMKITIWGNRSGSASDDYRTDDTEIVTNLVTSGYRNSQGDSAGDFLKDASTAAGPLRIASINVAYGYGGAAQAGDPRYRGRLVNDRWRNLSRSDATTPTTTPAASPDRVTSFTDKAEMNVRAFGTDWYDNSGDRPLAFVRNAAMLSIGELGHIAAAEYPWRTLYLQHPERPANTSQTGPKDEIPLRRRTTVDYVLVDLLRAGGEVTRSGGVNINTQQQFVQSGADRPVMPLQALFVGIPLSTSVSSPTPAPLTQAAPSASPSPADRLSTGVNLLVSSMTVAPIDPAFVGSSPVPYRVASVSNKRASVAGETPTADYSPARPYFLSAELASTLSRLISASESSDTGASTSRSKVVYSALRGNPVSTTTVQFYRRDFQVEQAFRAVSNSVTTRGNVFRVLYVGQSIRDTNNNGDVDHPAEVAAEYLGEAYVERAAVFTPAGTNPDGMRTSDSVYRILANRVITE